MHSGATLCITIAFLAVGRVADCNNNDTNHHNNNNNNVILCNSDRSKCEDFGTSSDLEALAAVNEWWNEISSKGKVGCQAKEAKREEALDHNIEPFLRSRKCNELELLMRREPITFKGQIANNLFQGPGKLKISVKDMHIDASCYNICIDLNPVMGHMPANITGHFVDGIPHGMAKIDMKDGFTLIGTFNKGVLHGFCRLWNENGQLVFAGRVWNGQTKGTTWNWNYREGVRIAFRGEALILSDNTEEEVQSDSAIVLLDSGLFIGGDYMRHNDLTANARPVKLKSINRDVCMLSIKWEKMEGTPMVVRPKNNTLEVAFQGFQANTLKCDNRGNWNEINVGNTLKTWIRNLWNISNDMNWLSHESVGEISTNAPLMLSEIKQVKDHKFTAKMLGSEEHVPFKVIQGEIRSGLIHGSVRFDFDIKLAQKFPIVNERVCVLRGYMNKGVLETVVVIELEDKRVIYAKVKQGVLHGTAILLGMRHILPLAKEYTHISNDVEREIGFVVNFNQGNTHGIIWHQMSGGGFMHGKLDSLGKFTGSKMAFIYPDMETAIYGSFEDFVMKEGRKSSAIAERCNEYGIKEVRFSEPVGPVMWYSPPTNVSFGNGPQNMDPYEEKHIYLANSSIMPLAGEGIFARIDIAANELVCLISGTIYRNEEEQQLYKDCYTMNKSRSDDERRWSKKYSIGVSYTGSFIEIPIEMDYPGAWLPGYGCKINNDFEGRRANCVFAQMEHPRFGIIMSVRTVKPVKAGEELFVDYGYGDAPAEFPADFLWYHEAKKEFLKEQRKARKEKVTTGTTDKNKTKKKKKKSINGKSKRKVKG